MTVEELIKELKKIPQDFEVIARECTPTHRFMSVTDFKIDDIADVGHSNREVILSIREVE